MDDRIRTPEELESKLRALESNRVESHTVKNSFIRVEERLPENDGDMFLVLVTGQYNNIRFTDAYELAYYYQDDGWCLEQYPAYENPGVTHWLPLPEVP